LPPNGNRSIAARSARVAWELLRQDEQRRLLAYVEKALDWEAASPASDAAYRNATKARKGERAVVRQP
jgi:hypothetical protein